MMAIVTVKQAKDWFGMALPSGLKWGTTDIILSDGRAAMPYEYCDEDKAFLVSMGAEVQDAKID